MAARSKLGTLARPLIARASLASASSRTVAGSRAHAFKEADPCAYNETVSAGRAHSGNGGEIAFHQPHALGIHTGHHNHRSHYPPHQHQQHQCQRLHQQCRGLAAAPSAVNLAAEPSAFNVLEGAAESSGRVHITAYDDKGFTVGGRDINSSIICVGDMALCWSPSSMADVTPDSLALFQLIRPQPELLLLGSGQRIQPVPVELRQFVRACGMKLEVLSTRHAISTLNVLNEEGRSVAAALLLPSV
ncbi:hypothetical protein CLOM_g4291 [Closterium sp. NIES-68]|nr:hypothetical protein CLOM_g4291 [Closterium sp. NIES-68]GJP60082.1 hypothetical protein CLOP_g17221 [Closterium sp. NIES-67]GJP61949.1 hypothetical protein CLOP_g19067 [Closterium sp. NIES-67]